MNVVRCVLSLVLVPALSWAQSTGADVRLSPAHLAVVQPNLVVTEAMLRRLVAVTELTEEQLKRFGFGVGTLSANQLKEIVEASEDRTARVFVEYFDAMSGRNLGPVVTSAKSVSLPLTVWRDFNDEAFIADAVELAQFGASQKTQLVQALRAAVQDTESADRVRAQSTAMKMLEESRRGAIRRARGYKLLVDEVKKEMDTRDFIKGIGLAVEIGAGERQPTIAPLTLAKLSCKGSPDADLVFTQRLKDCGTRGVCRVESIASVGDKKSYGEVFRSLEGEKGRTYLDGCTLSTTMLIDGSEVVRTTSGRFISNEPLVPR
jgi:hypothetical protein